MLKKAERKKFSIFKCSSAKLNENLSDLIVLIIPYPFFEITMSLSSSGGNRS